MKDKILFFFLSFRKQLPLMRATLLKAYLPIVLLLALFSLQDKVPIVDILRDPNAFSHVAFYVGALSNIGVLFWWSAAVVAAFTYVLLRGVKQADQRVKEARGFFLYAALFTALLALDDLFMLHERVFDSYLGIPEMVVYVFYGLLAGGLLLFFWRFILRSDFSLLLLALGFFALSVLMDEWLLYFFVGMPEHLSILFEDTAKLLGIVSWLTYFLRAALTNLREVFSPSKQRTRVAALEGVSLTTKRLPTPNISRSVQKSK